jgi:signal peptidase I
MKNYRRILKWSLWIIFILIFSRIFLFQVARVDNFHMASTLLPGDRVIVNKHRAGLRLPMSIIGLSDAVRLPYLRLPAIKKIRRQEVAVFNYPVGSDRPIDRKRLMISRIIGLPTDTVMIKDKVVSVNNKALTPPVTGRKEYRVVTSGAPVGKDFFYKYDIENARLVADIGIYDMDLPDGIPAVLEKLPGIQTVRETKQFLGDASVDYYPLSGFFLWNRDQFGPFRVPAKGMTVAIDIRTIDFYRDLIETHEGHDLLVDFAGVHMDGQLITSYTFQKNYYFVLSDNRDNPDDSRKIGFIPEDHIVGTTGRIIWSHQNKFAGTRKFHLGRIFKKVR